MFFAITFPNGWLATMGLVGLIFGSFLNVVIFRLPVMMARRCQQDNSDSKEGQDDISHESIYNLCWPPSMCFHCRQRIPVIDNVPLLSWLWLKGRSRCCQQPLPVQYPLVEAATMLAFIVAGKLWAPGLFLLGVLVLLSFLIVLTVIDMRTFLLPDELTLLLLWVGLVFNLFGEFVPLDEAVIGAMVGYTSLWLVYCAFKYITAKDALGYGDFKLLAALGAWLGWRELPNLILFASLGGLCITLVWRLLHRKEVNAPLAFGPWLAAGGMFCLIVDFHGTY